MTRCISAIKTLIFHMELFEVVGAIASFAAIAVFLLFSHRFEEVYGITGFHWSIFDEVVGMYENIVPLVFTGVIALLAILYRYFRRSRFRYSGTFAYLIRVMLAFCILMIIYKVIMFYIAVFNQVDKDAVLQEIERWLFAGKLLSQWLEPIVCRPLTDFFSALYMSWFILTYATVLVMVTHSRRAVSDYTFTAIFTFYIGYFTYLLVPVMGPLFTVSYAHPIGGIAAVFAHDQALVSRDCFPSLHTGISIVMMVQIWRYRRKWAWFYIPVGILIIVSTLYLRIHYVPDVIAGASLAVATTQLSPLFLRWWDKRRRDVVSDSTNIADTSSKEGIWSNFA